MAYFSLSYQLNKDKNYQPLWDEMKRLGSHKAMRDYYLLDVNLDTAADLLKHLTQFVDNKDDMLFVAKLSERPSSLRCYEGTRAWIDARF
jgi:hypothetical protein